jgi:hypothetical protein
MQRISKGEAEAVFNLDPPTPEFPAGWSRFEEGCGVLWGMIEMAWQPVCAIGGREPLARHARAGSRWPGLAWVLRGPAVVGQVA